MMKRFDALYPFFMPFAFQVRLHSQHHRTISCVTVGVPCCFSMRGMDIDTSGGPLIHFQQQEPVVGSKRIALRAQIEVPPVRFFCLFETTYLSETNHASNKRRTEANSGFRAGRGEPRIEKNWRPETKGVKNQRPSAGDENSRRSGTHCTLPPQAYTHSPASIYQTVHFCTRAAKEPQPNNFAFTYVHRGLARTRSFSLQNTPSRENTHQHRDPLGNPESLCMRPSEDAAAEMAVRAPCHAGVKRTAPP